MSVDCSHLCWNFVAVPNIVTSYFQLSQSQSWLQPPLLSSLSLSSNMVLPDITTNQRTGHLTEKLFHIKTPPCSRENGRQGIKGPKQWNESPVWFLPILVSKYQSWPGVAWKNWKWKLVTEWKALYYESGFYESPTHPHLLLLLGDANTPKNQASEDFLSENWVGGSTSVLNNKGSNGPKKSPKFILIVNHIEKF